MRPEPPLVFHPSSLADLPLDLVIDRLDGGLGDEDGYLITLRDVRRGLQIGFRRLEEHPVDVLLGWHAPRELDALGVAVSGTARSLDAGPGPDDAAGRVRIVQLHARDGRAASRIRRVGADPPNVLDTGAAEGDVADCLRRAIGLPTPPPPCGPVAWWAVDWLDATLEAVCREPARPWTWARVSRLHPLLGAAPARQPRGPRRARGPGGRGARLVEHPEPRSAAEGGAALSDRSRAGGLDGRRDVRPVAPRLPARPGRRGGRSRRPAAAVGHPRGRRGAPGVALLVSSRGSDRPPTLAVWVSRASTGTPTSPSSGKAGSRWCTGPRRLALNRSVAVKVLSGLVDPVAISRFERECATIGSLSGHPHVVSVYDAGTTVEGSPYLAMEYLPRGSLADRIQASGPLPTAADPERRRAALRRAGCRAPGRRAPSRHQARERAGRRDRPVQAGRLRRGRGGRGRRQPRHRAGHAPRHRAPPRARGARGRPRRGRLGHLLARVHARDPRPRQGPVRRAPTTRPSSRR